MSENGAPVEARVVWAACLASGVVLWVSYAGLAWRVGSRDAILDVAGAAKLLGVSTSTIYALARRGEIPGVRVGREWRFNRQTLRQWVSAGAQAGQLRALLGKVRAPKR